MRLEYSIKIPEYEAEFYSENILSSLRIRRQIERTGGIYCLFGKTGELLYVGRSFDIRNRILEHLTGITHTKEYRNEFHTVKLIYIDCPMERDLLETYMINTLKPILNKDKVYEETKFKNDLHSRLYLPNIG